MERDLATFLVALYVIVDDFSQSHITPRLPACGGPPAQMSDAEGLCLGRAAQWRSGVPWNSARGLRRYGRTQLSPGCPPGLTPRAFTRRLRRLWGAFILRQDAVADQLAQGDDDVMDGVPMPVAHGARSFTPGWLADIARLGQGGPDRSCYGVRLLMGSPHQGVATGWALASGHVQERWVAEWLCSPRAGVPGVHGPLDDTGPKPQGTPPAEGMAAVPSGGAASKQPILSAGGVRGDDGLAHGAKAYGVQGCPLPKTAPRATRHWVRSVRQGVETTLAHVRESCGRTYPGAHSTWGLLMRVAAQVAASNLGRRINRLLGRPDFACATLIV